MGVGGCVCEVRIMHQTLYVNNRNECSVCVCVCVCMRRCTMYVGGCVGSVICFSAHESMCHAAHIEVYMYTQHRHNMYVYIPTSP